MERLKVKTHLFLLASFLLLGMLCIGGLGLYGMRSTVLGLETVYLDRVVPLRDLKKIADMYAVNIVDATHKARNGNFTKAESLAQIEQALLSIDQTWMAYKSTQLIDEETRLIAQVNPLMELTHGPLQELEGMLRKDDNAGIAHFANQQLYPLIDPLSAKFSELIEVQLTEARHQFEESRNDYAIYLNLSLLVLSLALALGCAYAFYFSRLSTEAQTRLLAIARQAGMAEIATNVLHNVGNVLNSVNISAEVVTHKLRTSKALGLGKAVQLMNEHAQELGDFITRDEKGKLLPGYLNQLVDAVAVEQQSMTDELEQLTKSVDHIKEIIAAQQSYAGVSSIVEGVQIRDLVEDALRMNARILKTHQIAVVKDFAEVPLLSLDKHRILLILVNLIKNASSAMDDRPDRHPQLTLDVERLEEHTLRIRVIDNGDGIGQENLPRIFAHGFTTRKDGHGFGLHSCSLAAMEMGGTLVASSDGPGKGATFTLELPILELGEQCNQKPT